MQGHNICLGDICRIVDCEHKTAPTQEEGVPLIRTPNIGRGFLILDNVKRVSDEIYQKWTKRTVPSRNDLIMAREAPVGNVAIIPKGCKVCLGQRTVLIRVTSDNVSPLFLNYLLSSNGMFAYLNMLSNGATVGHLNVTDIRNLKIPSLPLLPNQNKIAGILYAYDKLIENNKRRIVILEKMSEELYREWFVRFRFPGYQNISVEKGIPQGWEIGLAENFFGHVKGKSYRGDEISDDPKDGIPFINLKSFHRGGRYREDGLKYYSGKYNTKQIVKEGDVVMAVTDMTQNREVVGRVARIPDLGEKGAIISLDVVKLVPKSISTTYLYSYLKYSGFGDFIKSFANGANVLHLKPDLVTQQKIVVPPEELRLKFEKIMDPIFIKINLLSKSNKVLELSRSQLLPRLISGKLSVEDLNIQVPSGMLENIDE